MQNIAKLNLPNNVDKFIYADYVCGVAKVSQKFHNLQKAFDTITYKTNELGLKVCTNKTKLMAINCSPPEKSIDMVMQLNGLTHICI